MTLTCNWAQIVKIAASSGGRGFKPHRPTKVPIQEITNRHALKDALLSVDPERHRMRWRSVPMLKSNT